MYWSEILMFLVAIVITQIINLVMAVLSRSLTKDVKSMADKIHKLVNSNMQKQLQLNKDLAERIASMADATLEDKEAASRAKAQLEEYMKREAADDERRGE